MDWQTMLAGLGAGNTGVGQLLKQFGGGVAGQLSGFGDTIKDGTRGLFDMFGMNGGGAGTPTVPASLVGQQIARTDVPNITPGTTPGFDIKPLNYADPSVLAQAAPAAAPAGPDYAKAAGGLASASSSLLKAAQPDAAAAPAPMAPPAAPLHPMAGVGAQMMAQMSPPASGPGSGQPMNLEQYLMMLRNGARA